MKDEGVIKFNCTWIKEEPLNTECVSELNTWRGKMYKKALIGCTEDSIGYGNISIRRGNHFIISGSGTGKIEHLTAEHYTVVTEYNIETNSLTAKGPAIASSESLTHAMLYQCCEDINAVIHVHHFRLWKKLLQFYPFTRQDVSYGTTEMATEIQRLFKESSIAEHKLFAMGGHEEGIIAFGKDLEEAGKLVLDHLDTIRE
jgi:ribulose-5-phosphate 4-epimerase/fuculose-1-phosphate aldolase